jgi:hypothetical protein
MCDHAGKLIFHLSSIVTDESPPPLCFDIQGTLKGGYADFYARGLQPLAGVVASFETLSRFSFALVFLEQKRGLSLKIAADLADQAAQKGWQRR